MTSANEKGPELSPTARSLGIDQLSRDQRIELVQEVWDSIAVETPPTLLTESQRQELRRRVAEYDADPGDVVSWEQVRAETLDRLRRGS